MWKKPKCPSVDEQVKKMWCGDFPGGPVDNQPPSSAGDVDSSPGQGTKTSHAAGQLSPSDMTTEALCSEPTSQLRSSPCTAVKTPCVVTKTWCSKINKFMLQKKENMLCIYVNYYSVI